MDVGFDSYRNRGDCRPRGRHESPTPDHWLRQQFGPEYDRTIESQDNRRSAESELRDRAKRRAKIDVHPLSETSRDRYAGEWSNVQTMFVDQPTDAVRSADGLVHRVMSERGYPMENFDHEADLISVDHPEVVDNFRSAHNVFLRAQAQQATTEDLRTAMLHYRSLFDELLIGESASTAGTNTRNDGFAAPVNAAHRAEGRNAAAEMTTPEGTS